MVETVEGIGTEEAVSSDRVAPLSYCERVKRCSQLGQCIELLQSSHVSAFKSQRLCIENKVVHVVLYYGHV